MAKKQSRRSVSLTRNVYERLREHCLSKEISMSQFVEEQIRNGLKGTEVAGSVKGPRPERSLRETILDFESQVATLADGVLNSARNKPVRAIGAATAVFVRKKASFPPKLAVRFPGAASR